MRQNSCLTVLEWPRIWDWARRTPNTIILPKGHSNTMTFLVAFFYTHLSMPCLSIIREDSSCSRWTNTEAHKWTMCWERDFGTLSLKWDILIKALSSGLYRYAIEKWRQKYSKSHRGWMTPRKMCLPDTTRLMSIWTHRDGVIIQRAYTAAGHGRQRLPPLNKKLSGTAKEKFVFPQWSLNGYILLFVCLEVLVCFILLFVLLLFLLVYYGFQQRKNTDTPEFFKQKALL